MGVEHRMHSCLQECRAQAHRFVKQVEREKIRQQEGLLGSLSWCHSSLRSVNTSLLWFCWRVSYCIKGTTPSCFWMERNSKGESTRTEEIVIFWFCSLLTTTKWCYIGNLFFLSLCFIKHIQEINWLGSRDWDVKNCLTCYLVLSLSRPFPGLQWIKTGALLLPLCQYHLLKDKIVNYDTAKEDKWHWRRIWSIYLHYYSVTEKKIR